MSKVLGLVNKILRRLKLRTKIQPTIQLQRNPCNPRIQQLIQPVHTLVLHHIDEVISRPHISVRNVIQHQIRIDELFRDRLQLAEFAGLLAVQACVGELAGHLGLVEKYRGVGLEDGALFGL